MSVLEIKDLHVSVETDQGTKQILRGVNLTINQGEIHAIMGPNGSGKSTLAYTIAGHPKYHVEGGSILLDGEDVLAMTVDERARAAMNWNCITSRAWIWARGRSSGWRRWCAGATPSVACWRPVSLCLLQSRAG